MLNTALKSMSHVAEATMGRVDGLVNGSEKQLEASRSRSTPELREDLQRALGPYPASHELDSLCLPRQIASVTRFVLTGDAGRVGAIKRVLDERDEQYLDLSKAEISGR